MMIRTLEHFDVASGAKGYEARRCLRHNQLVADFEVVAHAHQETVVRPHLPSRAQNGLVWFATALLLIAALMLPATPVLAEHTIDLGISRTHGVRSVQG